jgi:hypothetical protein
VKILLLNYEFPPIGGGSSPVTREIGKRYVQRGHWVDVVMMGFGDLPILLPTGLVVRAMKRKFGLPYFVSGHGSDIPGYNPDRFRWLHRVTQSALRRRIALIPAAARR